MKIHDKHDKDGSNEDCPPQSSPDGKAVSRGGFADVKSAKRYAYRNVYGIGIALMAYYSSLNGLFALQSTVNSALGLGSLVAIYISSMLVGFVTVGLTAAFGTKYNFIIAIFFSLTHILCNYYPTWYTLIPSAVLCGCGIGIAWASVTAHVSGVSGLVAPVLNKERSYLNGKFTGVVFFWFHISYTPGNLASSLILYPYTDNTSDALPYTEEYSGSVDLSMIFDTNSSYSCDKKSLKSLDIKHFYSLLSVYVVFIILSILIVVFCVDRLPSDSSFFSSDRKFQLYFKKPNADLLRTLKHKKTAVLLPIVFLAGMLPTFSFGTFTKLFVSDCFGIHLVGFTVILLGACSALMSMVYSKLIKFVPRFVLVLLAAAVITALITFLLIWERVPSYGLIFSFPVFWGFGDSISNTVAASLPGIMFPNNPEGASSIYSTVVLCGFSVGYLLATVLSLKAQLSAILSVVILATVADLIIEFRYITNRKTGCFHDKDLQANQTTQTNHANSSTTSPESTAAGVNKLFAVLENRRPSSQLMISEEDKRSEMCSSAVKDSETAEPRRVSDSDIMIVVMNTAVRQETTV